MKKTIKLFITAVLLFSATLSTYAQFENNRETSRFHFGIRAGLSSNTFTGDGAEGIDPLVAFTGGLAFDIQLAQVPVFIGFGVNYLNEGYKYKYRYRDIYYGNYSYDGKQDISAIHIPLVFGYHFNLSPNFFISPYVGGFTSYSVENLDEDKDWNDDRFNYGLRFGLGLNFGRLTFDAAYDLGLKNVLDDRHYTAKTGTFFVTLGVNLAGKR